MTGGVTAVCNFIIDEVRVSPDTKTLIKTADRTRAILSNRSAFIFVSLHLEWPSQKVFYAVLDRLLVRVSKSLLKVRFRKSAFS